MFEDDGISGAVFAQRPGLQSLLAALKPAPNFQRLVVESQSRIGRDTRQTMNTVFTIERAGVQIYAVNDGKRITLTDADSRLLSYITSEIDAREREKTSPLVRSRAHQRHANGFVVGGKVYGYTNKRTCGGCTKNGVGICRHPSVRVVNEAEAAVVSASSR